VEDENAARCERTQALDSGYTGAGRRINPKKVKAPQFFSLAQSRRLDGRT
jgi:hypothetical protein